MGKIWDNIYELAEYLQKHSANMINVFTSGGLDPLHLGHVKLILESKKFGDRLIVFVNSDGFLMRKKGYVFMPLEERMGIVASIQGVDHVVSYEDWTQSVAYPLELLKPDVFTKGGDRSSPWMMDQKELDVCKKIGCKIEYGVGGSEKVQSSSSLVKKMLEKNNAGEKA